MILSKTKYIFEKFNSDSVKISKDKKIKIVNNIGLLEDFYKVSWNVYKKNKYWVPPFWTEIKSFFNEKDLFWTHGKCILFVAYKNNMPVGRISAFIDNEYNKINKIKAGFFGFFECINDSEIARNLLNQAESWLKENKIKLLIGPINGRVDMGVGFLIKGFNSIPYLMANYSLDYYNTFVNDFGMKKSKDLVSYNIDLNKKISDNEIKKSINKCNNIGIKIRNYNRFRHRNEMKWWIDLLMSEFQDHWGYTSISNEEVKSRFGIKQLRWIVDPPLFLVAEKNNEPIGFRWSLPDYNVLFKEFNGKLGVLDFLYTILNKKKIDRGRFIIMGIKKEYRGKGIGTCLNYYTIIEMKKRGYSNAEYGWIDEKNIASRKAGEKIGGKLNKIYRIYEKNI